MRFERVQLAGGWKGTDQTVRRMERLVEDSLSDPVVRLKAEEIVRDTGERDRVGENRAISDFVRSHMKYRNEAVETIKTPRVMIDEIRRYGFAQGDCDDFCVLGAALRRVMGHDVRFRAASQRRDGIANHIFLEVHLPGRGWVADDAIKKDRPMGWRMPGASVTKEKLYAIGSQFAGVAGLGEIEEETHSGSAVLTLGPQPAIESVSSGLGRIEEDATHSGSAVLTRGPRPAIESVSSGLGQFELIGVAISAAATAATIAAQMEMQKKQLKVQKKAMDESKRQFDEQLNMAKEQAAAQERVDMASLTASSVGSGLGLPALPGWAMPAGLVTAAAIAAYLILRGK